MKNLIIIGARAYGREVYNIAIQTKEYNTDWIVKGFLDNDDSVLSNYSESYPRIISSIEDYIIQPNDVFICALGSPDTKKYYIQKILDKGGEFTNIIHPSAVINTINVRIGHGVIICPLTYISNDTTIGNYVTIQSHAAIGHDVIIGDYCQINALTFIGGFAQIGNETIINPGANIAPKKRVGSNVLVGINSSVLNTIQNHYSVYGNPAKRIL